MRRNHILFSILVLVVFTNPAFGQTKPFSVGEEIRYDIKKFGVRVGGAELMYKGPQKFEDKDALLLIFTTHSLNFYDEEKIYMDPQTYFPIAVERDINVFGKKEKIIERYESDKGIVKLIKRAGDDVSEEEINKEGPLDNIYCFIYRYRLSGNFQKGDSIKINLPTKNVVVKVKNKAKIKAANETYETFFLETEPPQFSVWFDTGSKKIPVRIDGAVGLNKAVMIMKDYQTN